MSKMEKVVSMEKMGSKKLVKNEAGQDELIEVGKKLSIVIEERVRSIPSSMEQKFKTLEAAVDKASQSEYSKPCIQRVPFMLRDNKNFKKYCEPRAVSIGPLHHGDPKLKLVENLKLKLAGLFIKEQGLDEAVVYNKIKNDLKNLKECYDEKEITDYDDEDLAWMFFVDGCALLHYIDCAAKDDKGKKLKEWKIKNDHIAIAQQDLFLLENQLPYRVLKLLISSTFPSDKLTTSIKKFIDKIIKDIRGSQQAKQQKQNDIRGASQQGEQSQQEQTHQQSQHEPTHLLEILRERLVGKNGHKSTAEEEGQQEMDLHSFPTHLLELLREKLVDKNGHKSTADEDLHSFRNFRELKAAGIQLKPRRTGHLTDISFSSKFFTGTLELSPLVVDDSTAPKFLNMIAYEMCPEFANDFEVTSYISFLDSLIDHRDDVKELRNEGILFNRLGSDKEVAKLFNVISTDLVPNPNIYSEVIKNIQKHYDKKGNTWIAEALHDHFSSPWTLSAFIAAIIALVLSLVQTWYAIHPV